MRILMYHEVVKREPPNIHAITAEQFEAQLQWFREHEYVTVHITEETIRRADSHHVALTFDDGYLDFYEIVYPLLQKYDMTASVYLLSGLMGSQRTWQDSTESNQTQIMSWQQVQELNAHGIQIGAHTVTHADLTTITPNQQRVELTQSRTEIEQRLGVGIDVIAYPFGHTRKDIRQLAQQCGYRCGLSSRPHYAGSPGRDLLDLQRITMLATDTPDIFSAKMRGTLRQYLTWYNWYTRVRVKQLFRRTH